MINKRLITVIFILLFISTSTCLTAQNTIVFLTDKNEFKIYDTYGPFSDSLFIEDLEAAGYNVIVPNYDRYKTVGPDQIDTLKMADLVILGRGVNSSTLDDADDSIWEQLFNPVMSMSPYHVRGIRLGWIRCNSQLEMARLDTFYAKAEIPSDPAFTGISILENSLIPFAMDDFCVIEAGADATNGEVLLTLTGIGTAYYVEESSGAILETFNLADYSGYLVMARWAPGDSMYSGLDSLGNPAAVPQGYRAYIATGDDHNYDEVRSTRTKNFYVFTDEAKQIWLNEVTGLINNYYNHEWISVWPHEVYMEPEGVDSTLDVANLMTSGKSWSASVVEGSSWLTITSGSSGLGEGQIVLHCDQNNSGFGREGVIEVTAGWATNSPQRIRIIQSCYLVVTSTADNGPGTLRQALLDAVRGSVITFDPTVFPPDNPATIVLTSGMLPLITQGNLTIDATNTGVVIDGSSLSSGQGLSVTSDNNIIKGLQIINFPYYGMFIYGEACYNIIGGSKQGEGNVIVGNKLNGVVIAGTGTNYNKFIGNFVGTDASGTIANPNGGTGVLIDMNAKHNTIGGYTTGERNVICGQSNGVGIWRNADSNIVVGNYIGVDKTGKVALPNDTGILLDAKGNVIGPNNIISGNKYTGVQINGEGTRNNTVIGNFIGTNSSGIKAISNGQNGITIGYGAKHNTIGGILPGEQNVIGGSINGIGIWDVGTDSNTVMGNYIGVDTTGINYISNRVGVVIANGAQGNIIGSGNFIIKNGIGVQVSSNNNTIKGNLIKNNIRYQTVKWGVGIDVYATSTTVENNTIVENYDLGIVFQSNSSGIIKNNIIAQTKYIGIDSKTNSILTICYNNVWNNGPNYNNCSVGTGDISANPMFVDPDNNDYHLQAGSPCIDAGDPDSPKDPDSTRADMGALYFDQRTLYPVAPQNLSATSGNQQITLSWSPNTEFNLAYYKIYRSQKQGFTPASGDSIDIVNKDSTSYTDTGLTNNITYYYRISAVNIVGNESQFSEEISATPGLFPQISVNPSDIDFGNVQVEEYKEVILSISNLGNDTLEVVSMNITPQVFKLINSELSFKISPHYSKNITLRFSPTELGTQSGELNIYNNTATSPKTVPLTGCGIDTILPSVPVNLAATPGNQKMTLTWSQNTESDVAYYKIYRSQTQGFTPTSVDSIAKVDYPDTSYVDTGLTNGQTYYYRISAVDNAGNESGLNEEVSATPSRSLVVTSTADSGPGTLRQALFDAVKGDVITFDPTGFPPDNPATIALTSGPLPSIMQGNITIDGSNAGVILNGSSLSSGDGLHLTSNSNKITGLQILYFPGNGVQIDGGVKYNTIGGDQTLGSGPMGHGNLISGNKDGIEISHSGTDSNTVIGNYIGTDVNGTESIGNTGYGVRIRGGSKYNIIGGTTEVTRNVISGNQSIGIQITNIGTEWNVVSGNYIGLDVTGTLALPNKDDGISIQGNARYNLIGGNNSKERNIISGNGGEGITIVWGMSNTISGNYIGTDGTGTIKIGNKWAGVGICRGSMLNIIGAGGLAGNGQEAGNLILGNNGSGIYVTESSNNNVIKDNFIIGNTTQGIWFISSSSTVTNNTIVNNNSDGIAVFSYSSVTIKNNIIVQNKNKGIHSEGRSILTISYNNVWNNSTNYSGFSAGTGDISANPMFVDPDNNDYYLQAGSPCIDAGDPSSSLDPDGTRADMGALYFDQQNLYPTAPQNLSATSGNQQIILSWTPNTEFNLSYYKIYRSQTQGFTPAAVDSVATADKASISYTDTELINNINYYYRISAVNAVGNESPYSEEAAATPGIYKLSVLPNPFTPNNDGFNDYVTFKFPGMFTKPSKILIFDISGKRISRLSSLSSNSYKWYGVDESGRYLEPGVYIYIIRVDGKNQHSGTVTLMR